ncbi:MAG: class II glutamine amidotransferase [Bacillota bacterium]|jgi:hypothetical protein
MCKLLGMSISEPVSCGFLFQGVAERGKSNPDGWSIALYPEGSKYTQFIKEPISLLCYLLQAFEDISQNWSEGSFKKLESIMERSNDFRSFNCLLSNARKWDEIDRLIKEDMEKVLLPAAAIDFLRAGIDDKVLACVRCLTFYKEGVSFCRKCLHDTVELDTSIADIIFTLNEKGYRTESCCCGDSSFGIPYVCFGIDIVGLNPPTNFDWRRGGAKSVLTMIPYHKSKGIVRNRMMYSISEKVVEKYRVNNIEALRNWANKLPNASVGESRWAKN